MGLGDILKTAFGENKSTNSEKYNCPNCKTLISLSLERCPSCGTRIKSMFKIKCPKCHSLNYLDVKSCYKCNYSFSAKEEKSKKKTYECPMCSYPMEGLLTSCPSCGARFM